MTIRSAAVSDAPVLCELWSAADLTYRPDEVVGELASVLSRDPELVLVAEDSRGLVGSVFGAFDGRRAWVNRLATRPDARGEGIASMLMRTLEAALRAKGCRKVNLLVAPGNAGVVALYEGLGFRTDELIFMGKRLA